MAKITIPKRIFGQEIEENAIELVLNRNKSATQNLNPTPVQGTAQPFNVKNPNITKQDYIQVQNLGKLISKFELPSYNNMNWQDTHFKLHDNGLYMPTVPLFMQHFRNVLEAYKSQGKKQLFDAAGNPISTKELEDIYLHLTKNHINVYNSQNSGAWAWLDAKFNNNQILSEHKSVNSQQGRVLQAAKTENLESCIMEDCFVDLKFNKQSLPTQKSKKQKYKQGENIYFWYPLKNRVAGFSADSVGAGLGCGRGPGGGGAGLGVFGVADA